MGNDWTCAPKEHDFAEVTMRREVDGKWEPLRLYCRRCGWVREIANEPRASAGSDKPSPWVDPKDYSQPA